MDKIAWLAVIAGGVANIILSNLFTIPIALYVIRSSGIGQLPPSQVTAGYLAALHASPWLYAGAILCGALASFGAGALTALMTKHDRLLNGALSAWFVVVLDVYGIVTHTSNDGLAFEILLMPVAPALGAFGAYVVSRMQPKRRPASFES